MEKKYIMTPNGIIVFPGSFKHKEFEHFKPRSAGEIDFVVENGEVVAKCWGRSESLNIESHPDDSRKATFQLCQQ